jgi:hypothetical protein
MTLRDKLVASAVGDEASPLHGADPSRTRSSTFFDSIAFDDLWRRVEPSYSAS